MIGRACTYEALGWEVRPEPGADDTAVACKELVLVRVRFNAETTSTDRVGE